MNSIKSLIHASVTLTALLFSNVTFSYSVIPAEEIQSGQTQSFVIRHTPNTAPSNLLSSSVQQIELFYAGSGIFAKKVDSLTIASAKGGIVTDLYRLSKPVSIGSIVSIEAQIKSVAPSVSSVQNNAVIITHRQSSEPIASDQWHIQSRDKHIGASSSTQATDYGNDGQGTLIAIMDTGTLRIEDLKANYITGMGFLSSGTNPKSGEHQHTVCGSSQVSKYHGIKMATLAVGSVNGYGGEGTASKASVISGRVLDECGGFEFDLIKGSLWMLGQRVDGYPVNQTIPNVMSFSLGANAMCSKSMQDVVNLAQSMNVAFVASAGNSSKPSLDMPANCNGVISVSAHTINGDLASYSNYSSGVTISAPGGGRSANYIANDPSTSIFTSGVTGNQTSHSESQRVSTIGTSPAAAITSGVIALAYSANRVTNQQALIQAIKSSANSHPSTSACHASQNCGSGLLDAVQFLNQLGVAINAPYFDSASTKARYARPAETIVVELKADSPRGRSISYSLTSTHSEISIVQVGTNVFEVSGNKIGKFSLTPKATDSSSEYTTAIIQMVVSNSSKPVGQDVLISDADGEGSKELPVTTTGSSSFKRIILLGEIPSGIEVQSTILKYTGLRQSSYSFAYIIENEDGEQSEPNSIQMRVNQPSQEQSNQGQSQSVTESGSGGGGGSMNIVGLIFLCLCLFKFKRSN